MDSFLSKIYSALGLRELTLGDQRFRIDRSVAIDAIELEARVLYSAAPIDVEGIGDSDSQEHALSDIFADSGDNPHLSEFLASSEEVSLNGIDLIDSLESVNLNFGSLSHSSQQIVFIDTGVENWHELYRISEINQYGVEVILLDSHKDGIDQISNVLAHRQNVAAIHLVSHGNSNQINIGGTTLSTQNLEAFAGQISSWSSSLADGADFLIYGCNLASSESGRELVDSIGELCNCDIAASDDFTGHDSLGGDWILEYASGTIETDIVFGIDVQDSWMGRLATYTVTSTLDDGSVGTLRWAIDQANTNSGTDVIDFNIPDSDPGHFYYQNDGTPGSLSLIASTTLNDGAILDFDPDYPFLNQHSWFRIDLDNSRPQLSIIDTVIIDGYSQNEATQNSLSVGQDASLRIELTNSAADGKVGLSFNTGSNGSVLQGLAINDFGSLGVLVNYDVHNVTIQGNFIGTDITGTLDVGNGDAGIQLRSNDNLIGGPNVEDRNIISGGDNRGIAFYTIPTTTLTGNVVQNNYIGVDATGVVGLENQSYGIQLWNDDGTQILDNVISGNESYGIFLRNGSHTDNASIQGNMIGVGADGTTIIANGSDGIRIQSDSATGNMIGGTGPGQGNVIAGNGASGVVLNGSAVSSTIIIGNFIGTDLTGLLNLGNTDYGVLIDNGSFGNTIGGTAPGSGNTIAFNQQDGVALKNSAGNSNAILGNSIFENVGLGIDLDDDNETDNDNFDADGGSNTRINFPVITAAITDGVSSVNISGWFNTVPGIATYRLEFFSSPSADPGGNGEGQTLIGAIDVTTDATGVGRFNQAFAAAVGLGEVVSATATDGSQNTSEFSLAVTAQGASTATFDGIWMSTEEDVSPSGAPGLPEWTNGEVISFGGPSFELEPSATIGDFASVFNLDLLGDGDVNIDGIHYVTRDLSIGSGSNAINLFAGDILISTADDESFFGDTFKVEDRDLFLYRPLVAGDYSIGTLQLVLDMDSPTLSVPVPDPDLGFSDMYSVTLVEQDTNIGGYDLYAGEILFTRSGGGQDQNVYVFHVTDAGAGVTDGTADKLIDGSLLGFSDRIVGLDIVERSIDIGGETLNRGSLLISLDADTVILDSDGNPANDLAISRYDIVSIEITRTEMNGGTLANGASLVFEGADVGIGDTEENINAFTIVLPRNTPPTDITPDNFNLNENTSTTGGINLGTLLTTDSDAGESFTYSIVGGPDSAAFSIGGASMNQLLFDESLIDDGWLDYEDRSSYSVDIEVKDRAGNTYSETITLNVNDLNEAPVLSTTASDPTFIEDAGLVNLFSGTTLDLIDVGDRVTAIVVTVDALANGSDEKLVIDGQEIELFNLNSETTSTNGYNVFVTVTLNTATVTITRPGDYSVAEAEALVDGLAYNNASENPLGALRTITLESIQDDGGGADTQLIGIASQVDIQPVNDAPTASIVPIAYGFNEDDSPRLLSGISIGDVDAGTNDLEVTLTVSDGVLTLGNITGLTITGGANGSNTVTVRGTLIDLNNSLSSLTYQPNPDFSGTDTVVLTVDDLGNTGGTPLTDFDTASIIVAAVNDAPTTSGISDVAVDEDANNRSFNLHPAFDDAEDPDPFLTYTVRSVTNSGLFDSVTINAADQIVLDFANDQNGFSLITVRATDTGGLFVETTFRIDVNPINDDPFVQAPIAPVVVNEDAIDSTFDLSLVFADVDIFTNGDVLTYSIDSNSDPLLATTSFAGNDLILDYQDDKFGTSTIVVRATDSLGQSVTEMISLTVNPVNDAPSVSAPIVSITIDEDDPTTFVDLTTVFADVDDAALTYSIVNNDNGSLVNASVAGNNLVLDYLSNQNGAATIVVRATDAAGLTIDETLMLIVNPVNDAPTVINSAYFASSDTDIVTGDVLLGADDVENDGLTAMLVSGPANGTLTLNPDGTFIFIPDAGFSGTVSFIFMAFDGTDSSNIGQASIDVLATATSPVVPTTDSTTDNEDDTELEDLTPPVASIEKTADAQPAKLSPTSGVFVDNAIVTEVADEQANVEVKLASTQATMYYYQIATDALPTVQTSTISIPTAINISTHLLASLDVFGDQIANATATLDYAFVNAVVSMSGVSIGVVTWILRSGAFAASMMANLPAWRIIDPLVVLDYVNEGSENDESLLDIVEDGGPQNVRQAGIASSTT